MRIWTILLASLLSFPVLADVETETNDNEATADILSGGILLSGNLSSEDDLDFFTLSVNGAESLEIVFAAPDAIGTENQWLMIVQRPVDEIIVYQEILSPASAAPITRTIGIDGNGVYVFSIRSPGGSSPTSSAIYNLTVTPNNFQPEVGGIGGVWQDQSGIAFYSIHENTEGLLYVVLGTDPEEWIAYFGSRNGNSAALELVVGPGSATLEILFTSAIAYEARYLACQTAEGTECAVAPGELLYTASKVFSN